MRHFRVSLPGQRMNPMAQGWPPRAQDKPPLPQGETPKLQVSMQGSRVSLHGPRMSLHGPRMSLQFRLFSRNCCHFRIRNFVNTLTKTLSAISFNLYPFNQFFQLEPFLPFLSTLTLSSFSFNFNPVLHFFQLYLLLPFRATLTLSAISFNFNPFWYFFCISCTFNPFCLVSGRAENALSRAQQWLHSSSSSLG